MKTYRTSEIAQIIGVHPNTVRFYEECALIPKPIRQDNGYRVFTDFHIEQFKLARTVLKVEVLQNGLRKKAVNIIKLAACKEFEAAIHLTESYMHQLQEEHLNAEEAIKIVNHILSDMEEKKEPENRILLTRQEAADYLQTTIDAIRNWEMNGLLVVKRRHNGYRVYTEEDIKRLKIIRSLRCANYSLASIHRMLMELSDNPEINIRSVIDTPKKDDDIISACDKLLTSLVEAEHNAQKVLLIIKRMQAKF